jgi:hypothetical protein
MATQQDIQIKVAQLVLYGPRSEDDIILLSVIKNVQRDNMVNALATILSEYNRLVDKHVVDVYAEHKTQ